MQFKIWKYTVLIKVQDMSSPLAWSKRRKRKHALNIEAICCEDPQFEMADMQKIVRIKNARRYFIDLGYDVRLGEALDFVKEMFADKGMGGVK